jgi:hypothetical protein
VKGSGEGDMSCRWEDYGFTAFALVSNGKPSAGYT